MTTVSQLLGDLIEMKDAISLKNGDYVTFADASLARGKALAYENVIKRLRDLEPEVVPFRLQVGVEYRMRAGHRVMIFALGKDDRRGDVGAGAYWSLCDSNEINGTTWCINGMFDPDQGETGLDIVDLWSGQP